MDRPSILSPEDIHEWNFSRGHRRELIEYLQNAIRSTTTSSAQEPSASRPPLTIAMLHDDNNNLFSNINRIPTPNPWASTSLVTAPPMSAKELLSEILALKPYRYANDNWTSDSSTSTNPAAAPVLQKALLSKMLALKPSKSAVCGIKKYKSLWALHRQVVARASSVFRLDVPLHSCLLESVVDVRLPTLPFPSRSEHEEGIFNIG
ncbi:MAG: hypothetical protein Q9207_002151 [Kuettlingeria erythrocarpa]